MLDKIKFLSSTYQNQTYSACHILVEQIYKGQTKNLRNNNW